jgi:hypothetical protein
MDGFTNKINPFPLSAKKTILPSFATSPSTNHKITKITRRFLPLFKVQYQLCRFTYFNSDDLLYAGNKKIMAIKSNTEKLISKT